MEGGVRVWVSGRPRTKGSLGPGHIRGTAGRPCKVWLKESGEYSVVWKKVMIAAIRGEVMCSRWPLPVRVDTFFRFERLSLSEARGEDAWPVRQTGEYAHGDEDKLRRNALDALTQSALLADDCQVVGGQNWKRYCRSGEPAGVLIVVTPALDPVDVRELEIACLGEVR